MNCEGIVVATLGFDFQDTVLGLPLIDHRAGFNISITSGVNDAFWSSMTIIYLSLFW